MAAPTPLPLNPVLPLPSIGRKSTNKLATFCVLAIRAWNEALERPSPETVPEGGTPQVATAAKETGDSLAL